MPDRRHRKRKKEKNKPAAAQFEIGLGRLFIFRKNHPLCSCPGSPAADFSPLTGSAFAGQKQCWNLTDMDLMNI